MSNSVGVRAISSPARVTRRRAMSISRSPEVTTGGGEVRAAARRSSARMRASSSPAEKGLVR